jgi:hypothetical protein
MSCVSVHLRKSTCRTQCWYNGSCVSLGELSRHGSLNTLELKTFDPLVPFYNNNNNYDGVRVYLRGKQQYNKMRKKRKPRRQTCVSASLSTVNSTRLALGLNPRIRSVRSTANRLWYDTATLVLLPEVWEFFVIYVPSELHA